MFWTISRNLPSTQSNPRLVMYLLPDIILHCQNITSWTTYDLIYICRGNEKIYTRTLDPNKPIHIFHTFKKVIRFSSHFLYPWRTRVSPHNRWSLLFFLLRSTVYEILLFRNKCKILCFVYVHKNVSLYRTLKGINTANKCILFL